MFNTASEFNELFMTEHCGRALSQARTQTLTRTIQHAHAVEYSI